MKKLNYLMLLLAAFLLISSCGKDGAVGPTGPIGGAGAQGAVGPAGPAGTNGKAGSVIYSGNTVPAAATGVVGDYYINLAAGLLYGPKAAAGWGAGVSLKGANGAAGTPGSKIYNGTTAPVATAGAVGDYYLNKLNYMLYGPKTAAGWGTPISLQGPEGNANVKTDVFTLANADWLWNSQYVYETSAGSFTEYFTRYVVRSNNTITQDVLDKGMVLVYFQPSPVNNPNQWEPLPYQFDSSFGYTYNYVYVTSLGKVTLHFFFIRTSTSATVPALASYAMETRKFKIVTVTGQTGTFMVKQHINAGNYNEVSKVLGLWQNPD